MSGRGEVGRRTGTAQTFEFKLSPRAIRDIRRPGRKPAGSKEEFDEAVRVLGALKECAISRSAIAEVLGTTDQTIATGVKNANMSQALCHAIIEFGHSPDVRLAAKRAGRVPPYPDAQEPEPEGRGDTSPEVSAALAAHSVTDEQPVPDASPSALERALALCAPKYDWELDAALTPAGAGRGKGVLACLDDMFGAVRQLVESQLRRIERLRGAYDDASVRLVDVEQNLALAEEMLQEEARKADSHWEEVVALRKRLETAREDTLLDLAEAVASRRSSNTTLPAASKAAAVSPTHVLSLTDVAEKVQSTMGDRIVLTRRAVQSMEKSPYGDIERVDRAFGLLHGPVFDHLAGEGPKWSDVVAQCKAAGVNISRKVSTVTAGQKQGYDVSYDGRSADMNLHLRVGSSRNPERCFRVHFEFNKHQRKLVVHHAGRHLPTQRS